MGRAVALLFTWSACGGARTADTPARATPFAAATTWYAMVVVGDAPRCEPWSVVSDEAEPDQGTMTTEWAQDGVAHRLTIDYRRNDTQLRLEGFAHRVDGDARESGDCSVEAAAGWNGVELVVGSARWFPSPQACEAAIDAKRPVAMDFESCDDEFFTQDDLRLPALADEVRARSLARFERVLRDGGEMFVIEGVGTLSCKTIEVPEGSARDGVLYGSMGWTELADDGEVLHVTASLQVFDQPTRFPDASNPGYGFTNAEAFVSRGVETATGGYGLGCGDLVEIWGHDNAVRINDNPHYFDRSTCERAIEREVVRRQWFPPEPGLDGRDKQGHSSASSEASRVAAGLGPGVGGC